MSTKQSPTHELVYTQNLRWHIACVQEAGRKIGVPEEQILQHDASKWTPEEFGPYSRYFGRGGKPDDVYPDEMVTAWLLHMHRNPHHWQYWILPNGYSPNENVENGVVRMPDHYVLEMVADWMGASKSYTGSWDMTQWLEEHMPKIRLHTQSAAYLRGVLSRLGYVGTVSTHKFAHELE